MLPVPVEAHTASDDHKANTKAIEVSNGDHLLVQLPKALSSKGVDEDGDGSIDYNTLGGTFYYSVHNQREFDNLGLDIGVNGYLTGTLRGLSATRSFTVTITGNHTYVGDNGSASHPVSVDFTLTLEVASSGNLPPSETPPAGSPERSRATQTPASTAPITTAPAVTAPVVSVEQTPVVSVEQTPVVSVEQTPVVSVEQTRVRVTRPIQVSCPVGWQQQTPFGFPTPRVLIRAVEVEVDLTHHSIYTPIAIEIYKEPNETRENLEGWKLTLAVPYNIGIDYPLTAENSEFDASGVLRIESSDVPGGFPMTNISFSGQSLPGFDYRLFDELNQRVDFGISCYYHARANLTGRLELMESPRIERELAYESLTWDTYYLNNWEIPLETETGSPGAPSLIPVKLTTSWASLKKRSDL